MEIEALGPGDDERVEAASHLFDGAADEAATRRFLADEGNRAALATYEGSGAAAEHGQVVLVWTF